MNKTLAGAVVGGILLFVWTVVSWEVLPFNRGVLHPVSKQEEFVSQMRISLFMKGAYLVTGAPQSVSGTLPAKLPSSVTVIPGEIATPTALVIYNPAGVDHVSLRQIVFGLANAILLAAFATWFLLRSTACTAPYIARVAYCGMFGVIISFAVHTVNYNWLGYPSDYIAVQIFDSLASWLFAGLGIAAVVSKRRDDEEMAGLGNILE